MQKSRKLMMGVCGLALSSLFIVGNKSVVHADSVSDAQNNAITWDSDQDDSQVVTQQTNASQTKTEQAMPQKADDIQQNATQPAQNSAETSTVRSSSADRLSATNKSATSVQNSRANLISNVDSAAPSQTPAQQKVASVQDAQAVNPVVIKNPEDNEVIVHFVDSKGNAINDTKNDYHVSLFHKGVGSYKTPNGYSLRNPNGTYNITSTKAAQSDGARYLVKDPGYHYYELYIKGKVATDLTYLSDEDAKLLKSSLDWQWFSCDGYVQYDVDSNYNWVGKFWNEFTGLSQNDIKSVMHYFNNHNTIGYNRAETGNQFVLSADNKDLVVSTDDSGWQGNVAKAVQKVITSSMHKRANSDPNAGGNLDFYQRANLDNYIFTDDSGNVQSVSGNTVDVTLTKPQSVNPATDTRCQSQATRTIHINFPDGQIPVSYKDIVDSHGNLKQTVHFTRTATEDALTGNILQYGSWTSDNQDHNFIGFEARTLPRIPGYTLSIKPF